MNEEILKLIASLDASDLLGELKRIREAFISSFGSISAGVNNSSSTMSMGLIQIAKSIDIIGGRLGSLSSKNLYTIAEAVASVMQNFKELSQQLIQGGDSPLLLERFREELKLLKREMLLPLKGTFLGRGAPKQDVVVGKAIQSSLGREIGGVARGFSKATEGLTIGSKEFNEELLKASQKLSNIYEKYQQIIGNALDLKSKEEKITIQRQYQAEELKLLQKSSETMVSLGGILIDKNDVWLKSIPRALPLFEEISKRQNLINTYYDEEIKKKKETLALLVRQKKDPAIIAQGTQEILSLEKLRNKELAEVTRAASSLDKILYGVRNKLITPREASTRIANLKTEISKASKEVSIWGLRMSQANKVLIRLGGATTGVLRVLSRWRNRLLVLTFAMAGFIRALQQWIGLSIESNKQMIGLTTVAANLGYSVEEVSAAAEKLSADGIISYDAAVKSIKNLLSMGASLNTAVASLDTLKDAALVAGKEYYTLSEMFTTFTQGLKEGRSQITDNIGIMTNLSDLEKIGAENIKKYGYANGILISFMQQAAVYEGARVKLMEELSGKVIKLSEAYNTLKRAIGTLLQPMSEQLVSYAQKLVNEINKFAEKNKTTIIAYSTYISDVATKTITGVFDVIKMLKPIAMGILSLITPIASLISSIANSRSIFAMAIKYIAGIALNIKVAASIVTVFTRSFKTGLLASIVSFLKVLFATKIQIRSYTAEAASARAATAGLVISTKAATGATTRFAAAIHFAKVNLTTIASTAIIAGILAISAALSKAIIKKRELLELDRERAIFAKRVIFDTTRQQEIIEAISNINEVDLEVIKKYFKYESTLTELEARKKELRERNIRLSTAFGANIPTEEFGKAQRFQLEEAKLGSKALKQFYSEEIELFKKYNISWDKSMDQLYIKMNFGNKEFKMTLKNFKEWNTILEENKDKIGPIPQLQEEVITKVQELDKTISSLNEKAEKEGIGKGLAGSIGSAFLEYKNDIQGVTELSTTLKAQQTDIKRIIAAREQARDELKKVLQGTTLSETEQQKLLESYFGPGLKSAKALLATITDSLNKIGVAEEAAIRAFAATVSASLSEFEQNVIDTSSRFDETIDSYRDEISSLQEMLGNLSTSTSRKPIRLEFEKENLKVAKEYQKTIGSIDKEIDKYNKELSDAEKAIKYINKETKNTLQVNEDIKRINKQLLDLTNKRKTAEEELNKILMLRNELILKQHLSDLFEQARSKLGKEFAGEESPIMQFIFGSKVEREFLIRKEQTEIDNLIEDLKDKRESIPFLFVSTPEDIKTVKETIDDIYAKIDRAIDLSKAIPETEKDKVKNSYKATVGEIDSIIDKLAELDVKTRFFVNSLQKAMMDLAQNLTSSFLQFSDTMEQIVEESISSRAEIDRLRKLGLISDEEYNRRSIQIEENGNYARKVALHEGTEATFKAMRDRLAALAVEMAVKAAVFAVLQEWSEAGRYALAASIAGGAAGIANIGARSHGRRAAYWRGIAQAESTKYEGGGGDTRETTGKGSTAGSTIQGQPLTVTINPSVTIIADYAFLGDTVQEVGEKMSQVIINEVNEAIETGKISLSKYGG